MSKMSFQARNLSRGSKIFAHMVKETENTNILCLAGSMVSAGMKKVIHDLVETNMIDCIVSTGANMVDMDFFEGLGFSHYLGDCHADDEELRKASVDRIYDTYISEDDLRVCDSTITKIANELEPKAYSSRELMFNFGKYLDENNLGEGSILRLCYKKNVPVFVPSLSDCSAGFGLVLHQKENPKNHVSHDSIRDFSELGEVVMNSASTGLLIIGGGVPKNFTQDTVVLADLLGKPISMHKYAVQLTVADERDGALSGSTLKEAHSWGKVEEGAEQMVFGEATVTFPILASYAFHKEDWKKRSPKNLTKIF